MFLLKDSFKWISLKKLALIMIIRLNILCKDNLIYNLHTKNTPIFNLYGAKKAYQNIIKNTNIFNETTKKLKNKNNSRIFNNTTLNKIQSIFNYSALAIDLNSNFNESSTLFSFLINSNNPLKIIKGGGGKTLMLIPSLELKSFKLENI